MRYLIIAIILLTSCEKDCYTSGSKIILETIIYPTYTRSGVVKREPVTVDCNFPEKELMFIKRDTIFNQNDTIVIHEQFYQFDL